MTNLKYLPIIFLIIVTLFSCKDKEKVEPIKPFDHKAQAKKDNDNLVKFLKSNYFDTTNNEVKELTSGKTALYDDIKLVTKEVEENNIDYKLYSYNLNIGTGNNPSIVDSVFVNYKMLPIKNSKVGTEFKKEKQVWKTLALFPVSGWTYSLPEFKGGINVSTTGNKIEYIDYGKAILFIPSGLAYRNEISPIGANQNLIFYIDLLDVVTDTDHDNDGIPSILEDINGDGNPWNDNTDKDTERSNRQTETPNFLDSDDDGDRVPTRFEDANKDGDPRNDFSDPNNPSLPDYLNQKIRASSK